MIRRLAFVVVIALAIGCGKKSEESGASGSAAPVELVREHECAACGMIVVEQSAPRAQLMHRDGTRQTFCSIGDLLAYLEAPSPHGAVTGIWVELQDPQADPTVFSVEPRPWIEAERAWYVTGIEKPRVMGDPVMVYPVEEAAIEVATAHGGTVVSWDQLRDQ